MSPIALARCRAPEQTLHFRWLPLGNVGIGGCASPQPTENLWSKSYSTWSANPGITPATSATNEITKIVRSKNSRLFSAMRPDNWVRDAGVAGSNPATPTNKIKHLRFLRFLRPALRPVQRRVRGCQNPSPSRLCWIGTWWMDRPQLEPTRSISVLAVRKRSILGPAPTSEIARKARGSVQSESCAPPRLHRQAGERAQTRGLPL